MSDKEELKADSKQFSFQSINSTIIGAVTTLATIWALATGIFTFIEGRALAYRDTQLAETTSISEISNYIGLVRYNCADNFGALFAITKTARIADPKKQVCYEAFLNLSSHYYPAALTLSEPRSEPSALVWHESWGELGNAIATAGTVKYDSNTQSDIVCSWSTILQLKGLVLPSLANDNCG